LATWGTFSRLVDRRPNKSGAAYKAAERYPQQKGDYET
jgi:hypothetical protein